MDVRPRELNGREYTDRQPANSEAALHRGDEPQRRQSKYRESNTAWCAHAHGTTVRWTYERTGFTVAAGFEPMGLSQRRVVPAFRPTNIPPWKATIDESSTPIHGANWGTDPPVESRASNRMAVNANTDCPTCRRSVSGDTTIVSTSAPARRAACIGADRATSGVTGELSTRVRGSGWAGWAPWEAHAAAATRQTVNNPNLLMVSSGGRSARRHSAGAFHI